MLRTILFLFLLLSGQILNAAHFSGSSITYECLGGNVYRIYLDVYLDCSGSPIIPQDLHFSNSCGVYFAYNDITPVFSEVLSPVCPTQMNNTTCNGGTQPGFRHYRFQVDSYLSPCDHWTIYWSLCCRNTMVNIQSVPGLYVSATLNNMGEYCDDSPIFTNAGVPFVCVNSPLYYNPGVIDPEGNTLTYSLVSAQYNSTSPPAAPNPTNVNYVDGYTGPQPIPGITLDPATGQIVFTPTISGNYTVVIQVTSYRADGQLIGSVINDLMFIVPTCAGQSPAFNGLADAVNSIVVGPNEVAICEGNDVCVDMVFSDDDANTSITVVTNAATVLPGATLVTTGTNPVTATLCWTVTPGQYPFSLLVQATDNACPIANTSSSIIQALECIPLPVELLDLEAEADGDRIEVDWRTATENGSSHFMIERSAANSGFIPIGRVEATGYSQQITTYSFIDPQPHHGTNYYRLRLVDLDASEEISHIVSADLRIGRPWLVALEDGWAVESVPEGTIWALVDPLGRELHRGITGAERRILPKGGSGSIALLLLDMPSGRETIKIPAGPF